MSGEIDQKFDRFLEDYNTFRIEDAHWKGVVDARFLPHQGNPRYSIARDPKLSQQEKNRLWQQGLDAMNRLVAEASQLNQ